MQPETAWQGAATYTYKNDYVLTLSAGRTSNSLSSFGSQDPATGELVLTIANFANFAYRDDFDAQFVFPVKITSFWTSQNTVDLRYVRANLSQGAIAFTPRKANIDLSTIHTLTLPGDVRLAGTDLFNTIHYWGYSIYAGANSSYNHVGDNRRVNLSLTYHLGGELSSGRERRVEEADRVK